MEKHNKHWMKSHESRLKLMHAAMDLFIDHGFTEVSVNDICHRAGLTKGAFYHHFASKEAIYRQLLVPSLDEYIQKHFAPFETDSTGQRLKRLAQCVFDVSKSMGRELMAQDFIRMLSCKSSDIYRTERLYTKTLSEIIKNGMARGELRSTLSLEGNIMLFACLMSGFLVRWSAASEIDDRLIDWDALLENEIGLLAH